MTGCRLSRCRQRRRHSDSRQATAETTKYANHQRAMGNAGIWGNEKNNKKKTQWKTTKSDVFKAKQKQIRWKCKNTVLMSHTSPRQTRVSKWMSNWTDRGTVVSETQNIWKFEKYKVIGETEGTWVFQNCFQVPPDLCTGLV